MMNDLAIIVGRTFGTLTDPLFWLFLWIGLRVFKNCSKTMQRTGSIVFSLAAHTGVVMLIKSFA